MKDICFWSIGDGSYALMLQALVHSYHQVGMTADFYAIADRPIYGATTHLVTNFDKNFYLFKFKFLLEVIQNLEYRYFVYLDADNYFVHHLPLSHLMDLIQGLPLVAFLENDCHSPLAKRNKWHDLYFDDYIQLMHEKGVTGDKIYNLNGGFFIVERTAIPLVYRLVFDFWRYGMLNQYSFNDEPALAYATQMLSGIPERLILRNNLHIWATDWLGVFKGCVPYPCQWTVIDFITLEPYSANPAIVHGLTSKTALAQLGQSIQQT